MTAAKHEKRVLGPDPREVKGSPRVQIQLARTLFSVLTFLWLSLPSRLAARDLSGPDQPSCSPAAEEAKVGAACTREGDCRETFEASFFTGDAIDTFAAGDLGKYLNPEASSSIKQRWVGGIDFASRISDEPAGGQVWVFGETVHGVRSSDVDCEENKDLAVCTPFENAEQNASQRTLFILRNATSLEGFFGVRWEFASLHAGDDHAAKAYLKAQAGFLAVRGGGDDAVDAHHIALGLMAVTGRFQNSYLEVGVGTNHVFSVHRFPRLVVDGFLTWRVVGQTLRPFVQLVMTSDLGVGADAIQTYVGFDLDLGRLFGLPKKMRGRPGRDSGRPRVGSGEAPRTPCSPQMMTLFVPSQARGREGDL